MNLIYLPDFLASISEQGEYLGQEANPEVADRFIEAVKDTTDRLKRLPYLGFTRGFGNSKLQSVRVWRVKGV